MSISKLAKEYRDTAGAIKLRIKELKAADMSGLSCSEQIQLHRRIYCLERIYAGTMATARHLETYGAD